MEQMKVYIIFRDVPFEFGEIHGVFETHIKAEAALDEIKEGWKGYWEGEHWSIDEWDVE